ncbi:alkylated DNA nucleotide flippase Atl1 [Mumia flava]|uniref:Alkylated DNA nucleotide flippase Atl1 n=1 Tax=Mumia flava TaxID=1348852 RepID=A0A0B2AVN3_9ACTN|nr:MGMT family protein [Mumia flava]PJJ56649.1 alkylated DNA nucleotide flippase Atl1 [Mumia flava]
MDTHDPSDAADPEAYVEAVLRIAESVPPGRVTSYGVVAAAVGRGGPRQVGRVMATYGAAVPWWRVIRADGTVAPGLEHRAREHYLEEGTPLRGDLDGPLRVDVRAAAWDPLRAV